MTRVMNRRNLIVLAAAAGVAGAGAWAMRPEFEGAEMTPAEAHAAAGAGDIVLIDIRRPDEWHETGIGEGAVGLDMRRDDFIAALTDIAGGDLSKPIAIICARGVRSDRMSLRLEKAGFTRIVDIPEGMLGSSAGPGWLARDLPVVTR